MSGKDNGGSAFPSQSDDRDNEGMSLRDWFAGQALSNMSIGSRDVDISWFVQIGAKHAYAIADAMIAEREKGGDA